MRDGLIVKYYRIQQLENAGFYIARHIVFATLSELIYHYTLNADGLCVKLGRHALRIDSPSPTLTFTHDDQWEIDRRSIQFCHQIGVGQFGEVKTYRKIIKQIFFLLFNFL